MTMTMKPFPAPASPAASYARRAATLRETMQRVERLHSELRTWQAAALDADDGVEQADVENLRAWVDRVDAAVAALGELTREADDWRRGYVKDW